MLARKIVKASRNRRSVKPMMSNRRVAFILLLKMRDDIKDEDEMTM